MADGEEEGAPAAAPAPQFNPVCDASIFKQAASGDRAGVERLLAAAPDSISSTNRVGATPLILAARDGHTEMIELLIAKGADPNQPGHGGLTALHHAVNCNHDTAFAALLDHGADVNQRDDRGMGAIHYACARGVLGTIIELKERGADMGMVSQTKTTPLMRLVQNRHAASLPRLIAFGCDVKPADDDGNTALHMACRSLDLGMVEALLNGGADIGAKNKLNKTPAESVVCATPATKAVQTSIETLFARGLPTEPQA